MVLSVLYVAALAQNLPLPPMPYDYEALEPHIDAATMRVHHLKHHQTYTDKLNAALAKLRADPEQKHLAKMGIDTLLTHMDDIKDEGIKRGIRNAGGGYVNHDLFFKVMSPNGGADEPESVALKDAIAKTFGSVSSFKQLFTATALEIFGSGWAWLVYDQKSKSLGISSTANQDTPAMEKGMVPILGLDVWEHAYYLKHQSNRKGYVDAFWLVINWDEVASRLEKAMGGQGKAEL